MSVIATTPTGAGRSSLRRLTRIELRLFLRERIGPVWGIGFPLVLLVIFGSIPSFRRPQADFGGRTELDIYLPVLIAIVLAMLSLIAAPAVLAGYRETGVLQRLRTTPVGPVQVLAAQLAVNLGVALVTAAALLTAARLGYHVALPRQLAGFAVAGLLAAAALLAIGLFIAAVAPGARAAQAIGTIVFFPMMFFAGLWLPIAQMPAFLRHLSHATPLGAAVQALQDAAAGQWPSTRLLLTMAAYAVAFGLAAAKLFRWE